MKIICRLLPLLALCCCASPTKLEVKPTSFDAMPGWQHDQSAKALITFKRSCEVIAKQPATAMVGKGVLAVPAASWQEVCAAAKPVSAKHAKAFFEAHFTPFAASGNGLFTGYYEPLLSGSRTRHGPYQTPVYRLPPDVKKGVPYYTRADINRGALSGRGLEIVWVDDPVMLFFAEVQGTAKVRLPNGHIIRIGYAGKNNRAYAAIGKVLKDAHALDKVDFFLLRAWLYDHPSQASAVMEQNTSYVFFRELPATGGPVGAEKAALTAGRSLAVDPRFIPYGMPLYVLTPLPGGREFNRLVVAQDTGGAIKGPVRGDIFFGFGDAAEQYAGLMQARGTYVLLVPNSIAAGM